MVACCACSLLRVWFRNIGSAAPSCVCALLIHRGCRALRGRRRRRELCSLGGFDRNPHSASTLIAHRASCNVCTPATLIKSAVYLRFAFPLSSVVSIEIAMRQACLAFAVPAPFSAVSPQLPLYPLYKYYNTRIPRLPSTGSIPRVLFFYLKSKALELHVMSL